MFDYLIVTEDGDVYGTNDEDEADKWTEGSIVIARTTCRRFDSNEPIHQAPEIEDDDDDKE